MCTIKFKAEKETKNTVMFTEILEGNLNNPVIGNVYFQKEALKSADWTEGKLLELTINVIDEAIAEGATTAAQKYAAQTAKYKEAQEKKKAAKKAPAKKTAPAKAAPAKKAAAKTTGKAKATRTRKAAPKK